MDKVMQPIGDASAKSCIADEEAPAAKARSQGKERADVIPGPRKSVAGMTDAVSNVAAHHTDHNNEPSSLRYLTTSKKPRSKGKRKADIGKSVEGPSKGLPSKGSATISEQTVQAPASAGLDDGNAFTFSMRPPTKSIVQQEKERLKATVAARQPTPGPSKARPVKVTDREPTPGPSNTDGHRQKKTGPSVAAEQMGIPTVGPERGPDQGTHPPILNRLVGLNGTYADKALHDAYKEVPIVPLQHPNGQSKAAQPNHHNKGPPLRSAMKKKASSSSIPHEHTVQGNAEGSCNSRASEIPVEPRRANTNLVRKVVQGRTEGANASRNVDTTSSKPSEQKRREVKRIPIVSDDQPDHAQVSVTSK
ncbi:hypothetical protein JVT61DRAFT_9643 [Boletus reticuloceps]|uniref:Uncharacterized protein n=1 Tax=Boletus reticuloceps TaxID=495285 RepID=A0A8I2YGG2_9AGAM|nr:hypothetical protein JVT61DRAFT_9643 [Boletus reticuloceps]